MKVHIRRSVASGAALAWALGLGLANGASLQTSIEAVPADLASSTAAASIPRYDHVVVVIEENTSESSVIGNTTEAPYINSLATTGANFTQSFAITHPSQPNYLALFSGDTQGVVDDSCPWTFSTDNLGQLIAANLTFAGYSETMPSDGFTGCSYGSHGNARKHNPWVNFSNLAASTNRALTSFPTDFTRSLRRSPNIVQRT
ncbi:alkaline phosphatase family protein [Dokdonella soli]